VRLEEAEGVVVVEAVPEKVGPWTFDDLASLPDELARRVEISDGVLEVSPPPLVGHQQLARRIARALDDDRDRFVLHEVGIDLGPSYRVPDLTVVAAELDGSALLLQPSDVLLAVEIVSPTSITNDRVAKPAQYAARGVRAYWRVEPSPATTVTAYVLRDGDDVYTEVGTWGPGETLRLGDPFAIEIAIDDLTRGLPSSA
jgi:Uma2 family endonuclease